MFRFPFSGGPQQEAEQDVTDDDDEAPVNPLTVKAFILEYLGNGTLYETLCRFQTAQQRVPERLIWGVFLCRG